MSVQMRGLIGNLAWSSVVVIVITCAYVIQHMDQQRQQVLAEFLLAKERADAIEFITQAMVICAVRDNSQGDVSVVHFQPSARRMFNLERDEIEGRGLDQLVVPADRERFKNEFRSMVAGLQNGTLGFLNTSFFEFTGLRRKTELREGGEFPILMTVTMREPDQLGRYQFSVIIYDQRNIQKNGIIK